MASGRMDWDSDVLIALNRSQVLSNCVCRIVPSGVIITRDLVPPEFIVWIARWINGAWEIVYDQRLAAQAITGYTGGDPDVGVHPDVLKNLEATRLDVQAEKEEQEGQKSGKEPPPIRTTEAGQPAEVSGFFSDYYRTSSHGRATRGWDFRRREYQRAVEDGPLSLIHI